MKIEAFKWNIEVTEYYVRVNGETVATGYIPTSRSNDIPTDCDGKPLEYGDEMVCVKDFYDSDGFRWEVGEMGCYVSQSSMGHYTEFTHSELKNFRKQ